MSLGVPTITEGVPAITLGVLGITTGVSPSRTLDQLIVVYRHHYVKANMHDVIERHSFCQDESKSLCQSHDELRLVFVEFIN